MDREGSRSKVALLITERTLMKEGSEGRFRRRFFVVLLCLCVLSGRKK